jgi:hypothetical protein
VGEIDVIREAATVLLPANANVLVVSGGDDRLLELDGRAARHFPAAEDGTYLGYHPGDSQEAIARLEHERDRGAGFLFFPETSAWWLDHYRQLDQYLSDRYRAVSRDSTTVIFQLIEGGVSPTPAVGATPTTRDLASPLRALVANLLPQDALVAVLQLGDEVILPELRAWQPPRTADGSVTFLEGLEALRAGGVEYLVIPEPVLGWLGRQAAVERDLRARHRLVTRQSRLGEIYELRPAAQPFEPPPPPAERDGHPGRELTHRPAAPVTHRSGGLLLLLRRLVARWLPFSRNGSGT